MTRPFLQNGPLMFAHRGGSRLWPENTLVAFRGALATGCRYLETDLHATRDGVLVVHHDERIDRTTNGAGFIRDHTFAELRRLDAAYRFSLDGTHYPYRDKGITIPTFAEVVGLGPDVRINVEIKQRRPDVVRSFWDYIESSGLQDRVLVAAAYDPLVKAFRRVSAGRVATSAGQLEVLAFWAAVRLGLTARMTVSYDALQVPVKSGPLTVVDEPFVQAAHRKSLHVHVWTIDDPAEMKRLLRLGVDGLMSDRPDLLMALNPDGALPEARARATSSRSEHTN